MKKKAVFLDRDGTIIADAGYISEVDKVRLLPGVADAIRRFADAGFEIVVVSNQSGVARGLLDEDALSAVHARMVEMLGAEGARLDGAYYCPYLDGPEAKVEAYRCASELRKPEPGMLIQAANERGIDLDRSWMIGDSARDVEAGRRAGCQTMLLDPVGKHEADGSVKATHTVASLVDACEFLEPVVEPRSDMVSSKKRPDPVPTRKPTHQPAAPAASASQDEVVHLLSMIHAQLDRTSREERQQDFSVVRLFATLIQMFAVVAALWGVLGLVSDEPANATARLALACFLQLASMSAFVLDRFR